MRDKLISNWKEEFTANLFRNKYFLVKRKIVTNRAVITIQHCCGGKSTVWLYVKGQYLRKCPFFHNKRLEHKHYMVDVIRPVVGEIRYFPYLEDAKQYADKILIDNDFIILTEKLAVLL
jgi:hypothetical protein